MPADVRYTLMSEAVEEFTAEALGASEALSFWQDCFGPGSASWFVTQPGSAEHERLWTQKVEYERLDTSWASRISRLKSSQPERGGA